MTKKTGFVSQKALAHGDPAEGGSGFSFPAVFGGGTAPFWPGR